MKILLHKFTDLHPAQGHGFGKNGPYLVLGKKQPELNILSCDKIELIAVDSLYPGDLANVLPDSITVANHSHFMPSLDRTKPLLGEFKPDYLNSILKIRASSKYHEISDQLKLKVYKTSVSSICYRRWDAEKNIFRYICSRTGAMFPDLSFPINRDILVFLFEDLDEIARFAFIYHSNHPTNIENDKFEFSSDFWDILRSSLRKKFGEISIFCFPGNIGDVRSNKTRKRFELLPDVPLNRKFSSYKDDINLSNYYYEYENSISNLSLINQAELNRQSVYTETAQIRVANELLIVKILHVGEYQFRFFPFELSSIFEKRLEYDNMCRKFNVSCSGFTRGYLPHLTQVSYGGYEVRDSLAIMGLRNIQRVDPVDERFIELNEND